MTEIPDRHAPEYLEELLAIYRQLELGSLLGELLRRTAEWTRADCGFALGRGTERRTFVPLAQTVESEDPRHDTLTAVDPERVKGWMPDGTTIFEGTGPFARALQRWPEKPPAHTVAVPVRGTRDRWAGVLLLMTSIPPHEETLQAIRQFLTMCEPAVDNALAVLALRELVIKDDTANCFNRRHFEEFLPEELSRASRFRSPVSLIFLDMDNLKQVNSRHGHSMGSRTLYEVSLRIRSRIRKFDKLFRFGGDEFCIVLPETEWHGALEVAERVRDVIGKKAFLLRELGDGEGVKMSASLGIASFPLHARTKQELVQHADNAMRRIKQTTKNAIGITETEGGDDGS